MDRDRTRPDETYIITKLYSLSAQLIEVTFIVAVLYSLMDHKPQNKYYLLELPESKLLRLI